MNVLIVGLGLIGGSYALGLSKKGYDVYGSDINEASVELAKGKGYIIDGSKDPRDFIPKADLIIIGLYPKMIIPFLSEHRHLFKENQIITDVCGVKTCFLKDAKKQAYPARYISHHPMAGKEKSGIEYANIEMFKKANFLICDDGDLKVDIELLKKVGNDLEFGRVSVITPEYHDKMIGFTSQLTHAIAVSLVNSDTEEDTKLFIGDSYRDLTRIAMINEHLWSELFLSNKKYLIDEIENFTKEITYLKEALVNDDVQRLKDIFIKSRKKRSEMEK